VVADPDAVDAVLLDMTMPEMNGAEVFERLQDLRPDLPVVLMSGYHEDELTSDLGARISGFVQKPFTPADLAKRMRIALDGAAHGEPGPDRAATGGAATDAREP
jgi:CheY-like chemotaxis protein